jgi:arylsulfatase A-like enzyme
VTSTLVLGVDYPALIDGVGAGMDDVIVGHDQRWTNAIEVTGQAMADLRKATAQPGRRHFLWVHYFDAHAPTAEALPPTTQEGGRAAREYYLAGLRLIDRELGEMLDALQRRQVLQRALVIVTADHGEAFGEHGLYFHNVSGYEPLVHVPAFLLAPGIKPNTFEGLVSHRDLYPTVLGAFGLVRRDPGAERFGRSWLRLREAPRQPLHQFVTARTHRFTSGPVAFSPMMVLVRDHHKLVKALDEDKLFELYDLDADGREENDLAWTEIGLRETMERELETFRDIDAWP